MASIFWSCSQYLNISFITLCLQTFDGEFGGRLEIFLLEHYRVLCLIFALGILDYQPMNLLVGHDADPSIGLQRLVGLHPLGLQAVQ